MSLKNWSMGSAMLAMFAMQPAGMAQQTTASEGGLEEVTVTAQRREQSLQDVPIAVTAVSIEALQNRAITSPQDLQVVAPELKMSNNVTTPTNLSPSLRGSTQQDASLIVAESPFGIYIDDIYVGRMNGNNVDFPDIDSVELLRGPQGTLYGRNTLQGALRFNSRTPGKDSWLDVQGGVGNYEQYRGSVSAGTPFGDSGWAGSIALSDNHKNGEWFNVGTNGKWDEERNSAVRLKVHYFGSDVFDFQAFTSYVDSKNDALPLVPATTPSDPTGSFQFNSGQVVPTLGWYTVNSPAHNYGVPYISNLPEGSVKQSITGITMSWKLPGVTLKSITGYETTKDTFTSNFAGTDPVVSGEVGGEQMNVTQITEELQALGKAFDDKLDYLAGLYYLRESGHQEFGWYGFGFGPLSTSEVQSKTESYSAFGQLSYKVTDALSLTAGLRWTEDKKTTDLALQQLAGDLAFINFLETFATGGVNPFPFTAPLHYDQTFVSVTPKFAVDYKLPASGWADSALLYLSAAKGFKSGGVSGINIFDMVGSQVPYKPEENWTYELGLKSEFLDHKLRVNAAYFIAKVSNLVLNETVSLPGGASAFPEVNAGDTKVQGLELEMSAVPMQGLTVFLNPSFDTGKYTSLNPGLCMCGAGTGRWGRRTRYSIVNPVPPQLPWFSFSSGFDYTHPMSVGMGSDSSFLFGMDWFKTASYPIAATNDFVVSGYDRLNGYLGFALNKELQFRLVAKNIQDRVSVSTGSRGLGGFLALPPREYMLTFAYKVGR